MTKYLEKNKILLEYVESPQNFIIFRKLSKYLVKNNKVYDYINKYLVKYNKINYINIQILCIYIYRKFWILLLGRVI